MGSLSDETSSDDLLDVQNIESKRYPPSARSQCVADLQQVVGTESARGGKFTDDSFPADESSLWRVPEEPADNSLIQHPLGWARLCELIDAPVLFSDAEGALQVEQGNIGTCFLLGALSVLATQEELLRSLFVAHDTTVGIYGLIVFLNGFWRAVIVDDFVPHSVGQADPWKGKKCPVYACTGNPKVVWASVVEKAYAKLYKVYENIDGGLSRYAMEDLTGGVSKRINFTGPARITSSADLPPLTAPAWTENKVGTLERRELVPRAMWGPMRFGVWKAHLPRSTKGQNRGCPREEVLLELTLRLQHGKIHGGGVMVFEEEADTPSNPLAPPRGDRTYLRVKGVYDMSGRVKILTQYLSGRESPFATMTLRGTYFKAMDYIGDTLHVVASELRGMTIQFTNRLIPHHFKLKEKFPNVVSAFDSLFDELYAKFHSGAIMSVAIENANVNAIEEKDETTGLLKLHAYGVTDVRKVDGYSLVCLRNPHACGEWKGRFADADPGWPDFLKEKLNVVDEDDGTFWMQYSDFIEQWSFVDICQIFGSNWQCQNFEGSFYPHGRCRGNERWYINPQYRLSWEEDRVITFVIRISQINTKVYNGEDEYPIGIGFRVVSGDENDNCIRISTTECIVVANEAPAVGDREVSLEIQLAPRKYPYFIVPYTSVERVELPFVLNVYGTHEFELTDDFLGGGCLDPPDALYDELRRSSSEDSEEEGAGPSEGHAASIASGLHAPAEEEAGTVADPTGGLVSSAPAQKVEEDEESSFSSENEEWFYLAREDILDQLDAMDGAKQTKKNRMRARILAILKSEKINKVPHIPHSLVDDRETAQLKEAMARKHQGESTLLRVQATAMPGELGLLAGLKDAEASEMMHDGDALAVAMQQTRLGLNPASSSGIRRTRASKSRGRNTKARGRNSKVRGRGIKARGRNVKARGRNTKARGRNTKARGRNTKARGRSTKARGRNTKARGRNTKARGRNVKVRGAGKRLCEQVGVRKQFKPHPFPEAQGGVSSSLVGGGETHKPDWEYAVPPSRMATFGEGAGGAPWSSGIFDCKDDVWGACFTCCCLACAVVEERQMLEGRVQDQCSTMDITYIAVNCVCFVHLCCMVHKNRRLLRNLYKVEEGDREWSGLVNDRHASFVYPCCAVCQEQREISRFAAAGNAPEPTLTMPSRRDSGDSGVERAALLPRRTSVAPAGKDPARVAWNQKDV